MKKLFSSLLIVFTAFFLIGCGPLVEIPPAHVAKRSTSGGLQQGLIQPSRLRLDWAVGASYDTLILVETADKPIKEGIKVFMPKDQLNLEMDVRGIVSVSPDESNVEKIFSRVSPQPKASRVSYIDADQVYDIYGANPIREVARTVVTKYSIDEIMQNRERIGQELFLAVKDALKGSPITVLDFGFADLQPPKVIVEAQEARKEREVSILRAEADKQVKLKQAESALEVAQKQQEVDLKEAETQVLVDKKLAEGVSEAFALQRALKIWDNLSTNDAKTIILMPSEAMKNPALMIGALNTAKK
jgi:hypothetical protein